MTTVAPSELALSSPCKAGKGHATDTTARTRAGVPHVRAGAASAWRAGAGSHHRTRGVLVSCLDSVEADLVIVPLIRGIGPESLGGLVWGLV